MKNLVIKFNQLFANIEDLPLLLIRILLFYAFIGPAMEKWGNMETTIEWFDKELGLPAPALNAYMAASTELIGAYMVLFGLGSRFISIPLIITMLVAIATVHGDNGWNAIGASANNPEIADRIEAARSILKEHGNYDWLTAEGSFVILQNGIEFASTYIIMLLVLVSRGSGRISADFILEKFVFKK